MELKSVGMMTFPTEWKVIKLMFQTTNHTIFLYMHKKTGTALHPQVPKSQLHPAAPNFHVVSPTARRAWSIRPQTPPTSNHRSKTVSQNAGTTI